MNDFINKYINEYKKSIKEKSCYSCTQNNMDLACLRSNSNVKNCAYYEQDRKIEGIEPIELKICPFCGSEAIILFEKQSNSFCVICQNKEANCNARIPYCNSEREAMIQWNKRVTN